MLETFRTRLGLIARSVTLLGLLSAQLGPVPSFARIVGEPAAAPLQEAAAYPAQQRGMSLQQAITLAQQRYQGRVVRAETKSQNGRRVHEIRILGEDGRVRTVRFPAG